MNRKKEIAFLCLLLFVAMFLIPFLAMGRSLPGNRSSGASSSAGSSGPKAQSGSSFKILDTSQNRVLTVDDRDFLCGTVGTEMSPEAGQEALKAQAVAAYTYYSRLRAQQRAKPSSSLNGADFSADTKNWQCYVTKEQMQEKWKDSFDKYYSSLTSAVDAVFGQVLKYDGELIDATYFAISSGNTEASEDVWGGKYPYLVSVASPGDIFAGGYQTEATLTADQFKAAVLKAAPKADFSAGTDKWVGAAEHSSAGAVKTIVIGGQKLTGNQARSAFGLRSANFTVSCADGKFTFHVKGYGHGVGMSQIGAEYMASEGSDYHQILSWYYPGTSLVKL